MVLRISLIVLISLLSFQAQSSKISLKKASNQEILNAALKFHKEKKWAKANKLLTYLIKVRSKKDNAKVLKSYKANNNAEDLPEFSEELLKYYHYRGDTLSQLCIHNFTKLSEKERESYKKIILIYSDILEESDYEADFEEMTARLEKFARDQIARQYRSNWFLSLAYMSWRDRVDLIQGEVGGGRIELVAAGEGVCVGGGYKKTNEYWEFNINGCLAFLNMTVGSRDSSFNVNQTGVPVRALIVGPSFLWKPKSKYAAFGIGLPLVYRNGDYEGRSADLSPTPPAQPRPNDDQIEGDSLFTYGYQLEAHWYPLSKWDLYMKFGKIAGFSSTIWSLGLAKEF